MAGRGKRAWSADEDAQASSSKQQKTTSVDWCADCWAVVDDPCRGGHRMVDMDAAERSTRAELAAARRRRDVAGRRRDAEEENISRQRERLTALIEARAVQGPVVKAYVTSNYTDDQDYDGDIHVAMATTSILTDAEMEAICAALEGLTVETEYTEPTVVSGRVDVAGLASVLDKLPDCEEGQAVPRDTVLMDADGGLLEVYFAEWPWKEEAPVKVFGVVQSGLDTLEGVGMDGECSDDSECFCWMGSHGGRRKATLSDVEFLP